jgi:hypothetical protein
MGYFNPLPLPVIASASEAIQFSGAGTLWIASSLALLAMTESVKQLLIT